MPSRLRASLVDPVRDAATRPWRHEDAVRHVPGWFAARLAPGAPTPPTGPALPGGLRPGDGRPPAGTSWPSAEPQGPRSPPATSSTTRGAPLRRVAPMSRLGTLTPSGPSSALHDPSLGEGRKPRARGSGLIAQRGQPWTARPRRRRAASRRAAPRRDGASGRPLECTSAREADSGAHGGGGAGIILRKIQAWLSIRRQGVRRH